MVEQTSKEGLFWLEKAAQGFAYITGDGVLKDEAKGTQWLEKAASQGHEGSKEMLKTLAASAERIKVAQKR